MTQGGWCISSPLPPTRRPTAAKESSPSTRKGTRGSSSSNKLRGVASLSARGEMELVPTDARRLAGEAIAMMKQIDTIVAEHGEFWDITSRRLAATAGVALPGEEEGAEDWVPAVGDFVQVRRPPPARPPVLRVAPPPHLTSASTLQAKFTTHTKFFPGIVTAVNSDYTIGVRPPRPAASCQLPAPRSSPCCRAVLPPAAAAGCRRRRRPPALAVSFGVGNVGLPAAAPPRTTPLFIGRGGQQLRAVRCCPLGQVQHERDRKQHWAREGAGSNTSSTLGHIQTAPRQEWRRRRAGGRVGRGGGHVPSGQRSRRGLPR